MSQTAHRQRVENALEGGIERPPVAGLSFVPAEALAGHGASDTDDPAETLAAVVRELRLDFAFVPGDQPWAAEAVELLQRDRHAVFWVVDGPLWPVLLARGRDEALKATAWNPGELDDALAVATQRAKDRVLAGASLGVDVIVVADDLAGSSGPLVSPDYFNEHLVGRYALLVATAASTGLRAVFHSDGDVRVFMRGLTRAGFIGIHGGGGLEEQAFERFLGAARDHGLAMLGGIDTLALDQDEATAMHAGSRAGVLASAGGLLVTDDGGITTPKEFEALAAALVEAGIDA